MHQAKIEAATAAALAAIAQHARDLHAKGKEQRAAWAGDRKELLSDRRLQRIAACVFEMVQHAARIERLLDQEVLDRVEVARTS